MPGAVSVSALLILALLVVEVASAFLGPLRELEDVADDRQDGANAVKQEDKGDETERDDRADGADIHGVPFVSCARRAQMSWTLGLELA